MFDVISHRYDRFTRLFSFGMDAGWKRELFSTLGSPYEAHSILDLACGTGDLAETAAERWPEARVLGLDTSRRMVQLAAARLASHDGNLFVCAGDMVALPIGDRSVDLVTVGYGIRNAPTPGLALAEIARVIRPGGFLLTLDFYRPAHWLWRRLYLWYLRTAGNLVGWLWHRLPVAYGYISPSVAGYLSAVEFEAALADHGFAVRHSRSKLAGGIALHVAERV